MSTYACYPRMYDCTSATLSEFPGICEAIGIAASSRLDLVHWHSLLRMLVEFVHVLFCYGCFRTPSARGTSVQAISEELRCGKMVY